MKFEIPSSEFGLKKNGESKIKDCINYLFSLLLNHRSNIFKNDSKDCVSLSTEVRDPF